MFFDPRCKEMVSALSLFPISVLTETDLPLPFTSLSRYIGPQTIAGNTGEIGPTIASTPGGSE